MTDDHDIDPEERSLFRSAVSGSRRLRDNKIKPHRTRLKPIPRQRIEDEKEALRASLEPVSFDEIFDAGLQSGDEMSYAQDGVQDKVMRKLRRGQYRIEAELDLHRMTTEQAHTALMEFIPRCQQQHIRCVRVIHGKGLGSENKVPVLKNRVDSWLRQWKNVLAFCSARRCDGGYGAVYVLLRRSS